MTETNNISNPEDQQATGLPYDLTVSVVLYNTQKEELDKLLASLEATRLRLAICLVSNDGRVYPVDASGRHSIQTLINSSNSGYGAAHNQAIKHLAGLAPFHLVVNPDIFFEGEQLEKMVRYMYQQPEVVHLMPQVRYADGRLQHLCREVPTVRTLLLRGLFPARAGRFEGTMHRYAAEPGIYRRVPIMSGCFMLLRSAALAAAGGFDERYFLYMEDVDLSMRLHAFGDSVYYTPAVVKHLYKRASSSNLRLFLIHVRSAVKFFRKWGVAPKLDPTPDNSGPLPISVEAPACQNR